MTKSICLVDDDEPVRVAMGSLLASVGYHVELFASAEAFLASGAWARAACLVVDVEMPRTTGPELLEILRARGIAVPVVLVTARLDDVMRTRLQAIAPAAVFDKLLEQDLLLETLAAYPT